MQGFAAVMLSAFVAAQTPLARDALRDAPPPQAGEAYVAELDADWNVSREVRTACPLDAGCALDLGLSAGALKAVHVLFDPMKAGRVAVTSRLEDASGGASAARDATLAVDRSGFGASHYAIEQLHPGAAGRIILVAVRVPGWAATGGAASDAEHT